MTQETSHDDKLLVLDDIDDLAELIGRLGESAGFDVTVTTDVDAFNAALERESPSVVTLDLQMPDKDGIEILRQLSSVGCKASILLVTGMDSQTALSAKRFGQKVGLNMCGVVQKPFTPESLMEELKQAKSLMGQLSAEDLGNAITDGALVLRYQPVVRRLARGSWCAESVEALPRWNHPDFGVLTPGQFIPLITSDKSELMRRLADYVLEHGILQLRQWHENGIHLGLRVNISAGLIADRDFPDRLERLLDEQSIDPQSLTLELSDVLPLVHSTDGIDSLARLRLKGINLSIDDFGDRGTSLPPLYALPINEVKVDKCVTDDLRHESRVSTVFGGLLRIMNDLEIICCAEGVETREQFDVLDELGCDRLQGYYVGAPMPAAEIPNCLADWKPESAQPAMEGNRASESLA